MADDDLDMLQELLELAEDGMEDQGLEGRALQPPAVSCDLGIAQPPATDRVSQPAAAKPLSRGKSKVYVAEWLPMDRQVVFTNTYWPLNCSLPASHCSL